MLEVLLSRYGSVESLLPLLELYPLQEVTHFTQNLSKNVLPNMVTSRGPLPGRAFGRHFLPTHSLGPSLSWEPASLKSPPPWCSLASNCGWTVSSGLCGLYFLILASRVIQPQNYGSDSPAWTLTHPLILLFICSFTKFLPACLMPASVLGLGRNLYTTQTLLLWHLLRGRPAINRARWQPEGWWVLPSRHGLGAFSVDILFASDPMDQCTTALRLSYHFHLYSHEGTLCSTLPGQGPSDVTMLGSRFQLKVSGKWLFLLKSTKNNSRFLNFACLILKEDSGGKKGGGRSFLGNPVKIRKYSTNPAQKFEQVNLWVEVKNLLKSTFLKIV